MGLKPNLVSVTMQDSIATHNMFVNIHINIVLVYSYKVVLSKSDLFVNGINILYLVPSSTHPEALL